MKEYRIAQDFRLREKAPNLSRTVGALEESSGSLTAGVCVKPVVASRDLQDFIHFPWQIYRRDPCWIPPYMHELERRLDEQRNPFFRYARRELFLAYRGGRLAGRVAAILNYQHNQQLNERTGFFGFFECLNDVEVAAALLGTAGRWLGEQGMCVMRGPVNGAATDEAGLLLAGYDTHPAMWEAHTPPYYVPLIESQGFHKFDDVFAYEITYPQLGFNLENLPPKLGRAAEKARLSGDVRIRKTDRKHWDQDVACTHFLYNNAFRSIEGHTDMSLEKFKNLASSFLPFHDPDLAIFVEVAGQPVGFAVAIPDANEVLRHFNGHISPLGTLKYRWYRRRIRTACFKLLGVLPEFRGRGLEALLILTIAHNLVKKKYRRVEISLASEKNGPMNRIIRSLGGRVCRQYRIYERSI